MDITALLALIPTQYIPYVTAAVTIAAAICIAMPAPTTKTGIYFWIYQIISTLAGNMGHAKSLSAPESKGIVGGPTAISAPLIATAVVPLATASEAQKVVTVMPDVAPVAAAPPTAPLAAVLAGTAAAAAFEAQKAQAAPAPAP